MATYLPRCCRLRDARGGAINRAPMPFQPGWSLNNTHCDGLPFPAAWQGGAEDVVREASWLLAMLAVLSSCAETLLLFSSCLPLGSMTDVGFAGRDG